MPFRAPESAHLALDRGARMIILERDHDFRAEGFENAVRDFQQVAIEGSAQTQKLSERELFTAVAETIQQENARSARKEQVP
jgi:hypothetical protein